MVFKKTSIAVAICCFLLVTAVLNIPEAVGLAHNGDFTRIIYPSRIEYTNPIKYERYVSEYTMRIAKGNLFRQAVSLVLPDFSTYKYVTSVLLPVVLSKIPNVLYNLLTGSTVTAYNLFWLGIMYAGLFAYSIYLILFFVYKRFGKGMFIFASFVSVFVFCDQGYILYFHSFYGEALQFVSTLLAIGLFLRLTEKNDASLLSNTVYYAVVIIMATTKNAYMPVGLLFSALPLFNRLPSDHFRMKPAKSDMTFTKKAVFSLLSCMTLIVFSIILTPKWISCDTNFNAVFSGILKYSATAERDLVDLGLDPSLSILKGWESYMEDYPVDIESEDFNDQFFSRINKAKILAFYLRHPVRLFEAMEISASYSKYIRPLYLGNKQNPSVSAEQSYRFSIWETIRVYACVSSFWFVVFVFVLSAALCLWCFVKHKLDLALSVLLLSVILSAAYNFIIPYISNGICDIAKHMFGFIQLYDMMLCVLVGFCIWNVCALLKNSKQRVRHSLSNHLSIMSRIVFASESGWDANIQVVQGAKPLVYETPDDDKLATNNTYRNRRNLKKRLKTTE